MIEQCLEYVMSRLSDVRPQQISCHMPPSSFESLEKAFIEGLHYIHQVPPQYPSDAGERQGFRRINSPTDGILEDKDIRLRVGKTTLHVKESPERKNMDSLILLYTGEIDDDIEKVGGVSVTEVVLAMLLENGIIAAHYIDIQTMKGFYECWSPPDTTGLSYRPHPETREEAIESIRRLMPFTGNIVTSVSAKLPDLVMLAVDTFRQHRPRND